MSEGLFDDAPFRDVPAETEKITAGEKLRRRQAAQISCGMHPLSAVLSPLRLHPDAARPLANDGERGELRCGSCVHRVIVSGGAKEYPKCLFGRSVIPIPPERQRKFGPTVLIIEPRASHGEGTDIKSWWPACGDWQAKR